MSLKKTIESRTGVKVIHLTAVECTRTKANTKNVTEKIQAAYLYTYEGGDRKLIGFWPGVTGYEQYYLDTVKAEVEERKASFTPRDGLFGPTKFEHEPWHLCAGSSVYDKLTTTFGEMIAIIELAEASNG